MKSAPAVISIHDVMPSTMQNVSSILDGLLDKVDKNKVLLLIVPGLDWSNEQIQQLKTWQDQGYELSGHGWLHDVRDISTFYHKLHSLFISRRAGEHLSHSESELTELLNKNFNWFEQHGLERPLLYVPPAWALGKVGLESVKQQSYRYFEVTSGIIDFVNSKKYWLPLAGFQADTKLRAVFLRPWNRLNWMVASEQRPIRISIHPHDLEYHLSDQLRTMTGHSKAVSWRSLFLEPVGSLVSNKDETEIC